MTLKIPVLLVLRSYVDSSRCLHVLIVHIRYITTIRSLRHVVVASDALTLVLVASPPSLIVQLRSSLDA